MNFGFLKQSCETEFLQSVFPVVSSSKTSKIIIVSTPNGMGNEFYRTWNRAQLKLNDETDKNLRWQTVKIDWWEVPGRDEKWRKQQLETFNGSEEKFLQEYGNCLCYSTIISLYDIKRKKEFNCSLGILYDNILNKRHSVNDYLINTPLGYQKFEGLTKNRKECIRIKFKNSSSFIECSYDHPFVVNDKIIRANKLKIGDFLNSKYKNIFISEIINIGMKDCFDLINVGDKHIFYANDIITHNSFLGSAETLIKANTIKKIKDDFIKNSIEPHKIQLHKDYSKTMVNIYEPPQKGHAYIIGADPSLGAESDYHAMVVYDITNTYQIKQVVGFYENDIPPKMFAYMIAKTAMLYNNAYVAIENNGCSEVVLDALWRDFDYDNIINDGGNPKTNVGIHSSPERKTQACLIFKVFIEDELRNVQLNDGRLIGELEKFERKSKVGKLPVYCAADGHDDYMMAAIWGLYCLQMDIVENYYDVKKAVINKLGEQIPLYILPYKTNMEVKFNYLNDIDEKFKSYINEYEMKLDKLNDKDNDKLLDDFIKSNGLSEVKTNVKEEEIPERKTDADRFQFTFGFN